MRVGIMSSDKLRSPVGDARDTGRNTGTGPLSRLNIYLEKLAIFVTQSYKDHSTTQGCVFRHMS